jgi:hypothetical protein
VSLAVEAAVFVLQESLMDFNSPPSVRRTKGEKKLPIYFSLLVYDTVWCSSGQQNFERIKHLCFQAEVNYENAITMMIFILSNITPCNIFEFNRRFGGTCRLHLQGRKIIQE